MLPENTSRTFLTANLARGPSPEPDISNVEFLSSYLDYTCWLRMLSARQQLAILEGTATEIEKLAALAMFYQLTGTVVEDALSMYVAWSIWSEDKSRKLPDILERISLRLATPPKPLSSQYSTEIKERYASTTKRVDVYAREYLLQIMQVGDDLLPNQFGIAWKRNPSVKLVPKELAAFWNKLGPYLRECLRPIVNPKGALLAACYNKIKHGPQISVNSTIGAARARNFPSEFLEHAGDRVSIRLLLQGARTQETDQEFADQIRVAPFLPFDSGNARRWFFQHIAHTSNALFIHGTWLYNSNRLAENRPLLIQNPRIRAILQEQGGHIERVFGIPR